MALSASSVLHYWSARYGSVPVVGGKPTHSRSSAGSWIDQQGVVQSAIVNTPRFEWADLGDGAGRRAVMRLEQSRTNSLLYSSDFSNAAWTKSNCTITTGIADPSGGNGACTLTATGAPGRVDQGLSAGSSIIRTGSVWVRRRTGSGSVFILDPDSSAFVQLLALDNTWRRFSTSQAAAGTGRAATIYINSSGDAVDAWGYQIDDAASMSSGIATTSAAATRSADSFYWDFTPPPQGMMAYIRFVERGSAKRGANEGAFGIADVSASAPHFILYAPATNAWRVLHNNGSSFFWADPPSAPLFGDMYEAVAILTAAGAVRLIQSINGAGVSDSGLSSAAALASAWSAPRLWLNSYASTTIGTSDFAELKIVKYADVVASTAQGIMDELRAFELGANGQVL